MEFIRAGTGELVVSRFGVAWQDLLKPGWLTGEIFLVGQPPYITVRYSPQSITSDSSGHVPIVLVNNEIRIPITELVEIIIYLFLSVRISPSGR